MFVLYQGVVSSVISNYSQLRARSCVSVKTTCLRTIDHRPVQTPMYHPILHPPSLFNDKKHFAAAGCTNYCCVLHTEGFTRPNEYTLPKLTYHKKVRIGYGLWPGALTRSKNFTRWTRLSLHWTSYRTSIFVIIVDVGDIFSDWSSVIEQTSPIHSDSFQTHNRKYHHRASTIYLLL